MGLPLYNSPVESDIRSRPAPKSPVHSRSAIRRVHRRYEGGEWAETRHRVLAQELGRLRRESAAASNEPPPITVGGLIDFADYADFNALVPNTRPPPGRNHRGSSSQDPVARRSGGLDERSLTVMSERWANLYTRAGPDMPLPDRDEPISRLNAPQPDRIDRTTRRGGAANPSRLSRRPRIMLSGRSSSRPMYSPPAARSSLSPPPPPPQLSNMDRGPTLSRERTRASPAPDSYALSAATSGTAAPLARLDGLGDRNRSLSLSPAEDSWNTLLTTLTPDPQSSVGSSFASTTASLSAANSQGAATGSSANTSMTGRDAAADGSMSDPNCDSGCENSDTEGDEDEDEEDAVRHALLRFPSRSRASARRSYADVVGRTGSNSSGGEDPLEFLGDMQRIVRHFARREDIPDEWWAEVGLSRTLSRASN